MFFVFSAFFAHVTHLLGLVLRDRFQHFTDYVFQKSTHLFTEAKPPNSTGIRKREREILFGLWFMLMLAKFRNVFKFSTLLCNIDFVRRYSSNNVSLLY